MTFQETKLPGVFEVRLEPCHDDRGFFARSWCQKEFERHGLNPRVVQCNVSFNSQKGTLRGMHYQKAPKAEAKLVRCTTGSIYDVVIDLRPQAPTFGRWVAVALTAEKRNMIYVPEGCAHGFLTLEDKTEVFYQMSEFYSPESACGVRWNDPAFQIVWPAKIEVISDRDRTYPDFEPAQCNC
jgi:dTDP-4-dehydrorhamnose 3,5-epimerase